MPIHYSISADIFAKFPDFCRGVVVARGLTNGPASPELVASLREAEKTLYSTIQPDTIASHPYIASWREAYRSIGIKPADFRPSVEALARRVLKQDPLPSISALVDLGNLVSIRHLVPVGAHAIDFVKQDIELRLASGSEIFEPFGSEAVESPNPGEIVFVEGDIVLTRRWTWRQSKHTLVIPETKAVEINVDRLPPVPIAEVEQICQEVSALLQKYCGGSSRFEIISRQNPCITL